FVGAARICFHFVKFLGVSFILATIFVALVTGLFSPGGSMARVIHLKPGWLQEDDGFVEFWFGNFGVLPLCTAALVLLIFWKIEFRLASLERKRWFVSRFRFRLIKRDWRDNSVRTAAAFVIPAIFLFLLACIVMFAPWEGDNTNIMVCAYLALLPFPRLFV